MLAAGNAMKAKLKAHETGDKPARRQDGWR